MVFFFFGLEHSWIACIYSVRCHLAGSSLTVAPKSKTLMFFCFVTVLLYSYNTFSIEHAHSLQAILKFDSHHFIHHTLKINHKDFMGILTPKKKTENVYNSLCQISASCQGVMLPDEINNQTIKRSQH